ncbi:MAG: IS110 family transposase [Thermoguttaceae bacterium]
MLYLGIDQHRKQLTVEDRNEAGDVTTKRQVSTKWESVRAFFAAYAAAAQAEGGFVVILEICGFNHWLVKMLDDYGCRQVILIQPEKRAKRKTDRRDASALAELLWVNRLRLLSDKRVQGVRRVDWPTDEEATDRQLTVLRQRVGQLRTRTINRIRHVLRKHNIEQECPTKGVDTIKGRKWLSSVSLGRMDRLEMDLLLAQWKLWDEQLETLDTEIHQRHLEHATAPLLVSIPGCGTYGSLALASRIGPIQRFPRPGSLANYWGLTPGCRNSGESTDRLGSITKQGSTTARFILGQLVIHVLRRDAWMRAWYGRIKHRRGSKIARVAVMRRLATIIWHMVKHQQRYVIGGPPAKKLEEQAAV